MWRIFINFKLTYIVVRYKTELHNLLFISGLVFKVFFREVPSRSSVSSMKETIWGLWKNSFFSISESDLVRFTEVTAPPPRAGISRPSL